MLYPEIANQENLKSILTNAFLKKNLPHSWLFVGAKGAQNVLMAHSFANTILCDSPGEQYCGKCDSCHLFGLKNHPDFFRITPRGKMRQMKKDDISSLIKFLSLKSYRGGYKVAVIEEADRLPESSANALLKSLEEPSDFTVFILTSKKESGLLPTIISRCQQIDFLPLGNEYIQKELEKQTNLPLPAETLAKLSGGHIGRVQGEKLVKLLENRKIVFSFIIDWLNRGRIAVIEGTDNILSFLEEEKKTYEKEVIKELKGLKNEDATFKKKKEEELYANMTGILKAKLDELLEIFSCFLRDILISHNKLPESEILNSDFLDVIKHASAKISNVEAKISNLDTMRQRFSGNVNQKLALESLFLSLFP